MTSEDIHIKKINNAIRCIRLGLKTPSEAGGGYHLNKLRRYNIGMYVEMLAKYSRVMLDYNIKKDLQV